ncbi:hypothetical protein N865_14980 [Intrasporangium oryzae NRRL B-24470]|uniref:Uncharacterized protein n=1 Tax=Intrasporangium oryzae NRRL B-24470 TaxID=1386089 RepID=W9G9K3_9MICO|nr:hypothetical protein [Intrasporangium oryzae]EWT00514.1 hypothetical protein N865_14980 [Intrasporangium oryzae NRRL B-24470]
MPDQPVDHQPVDPTRPGTDPEATAPTAEVPPAPASDGPDSGHVVGAAEAPAEPVREKRSLSVLKRVGVPVAVGLALIGFRVFNSQTAADRLEVGQCASRESDDSLKHRDCTDPKATYKVLFIKQDSKESAADEVCAPYTDTTTTYFEGTEDGSAGDLICLGNAK